MSKAFRSCESISPESMGPNGSSLVIYGRTSLNIGFPRWSFTVIGRDYTTKPPPHPTCSLTCTPDFELLGNSWQIALAPGASVRHTCPPFEPRALRGETA